MNKQQHLPAGISGQHWDAVTEHVPPEDTSTATATGEARLLPIPQSWPLLFPSKYRRHLCWCENIKGRYPHKIICGVKYQLAFPRETDSGDRQGISKDISLLTSITKRIFVWTRPWFEEFNSSFCIFPQAKQETPGCRTNFKAQAMEELHTRNTKRQQKNFDGRALGTVSSAGVIQQHRGNFASSTLSSSSLQSYPYIAAVISENKMLEK